MPTPQPLHLPRLLCLHGSGSNSTILRIQCRGLISILTPYFRLIFADGPFISAAGPGILPFFEGMEPYRRWLPPPPGARINNEGGGDGVEERMSDDQIVRNIEEAVQDAMERDEESGGTGEWMGLVGFSQGGKMAASILYDTQLRREAGMSEEDTPRQGFAGVMWRFAIILAGQEPLVRLSEFSKGSKRLVDASDAYAEGWVAEETEQRLNLPTVHVHGMKDHWLEGHQRLYNEMCDRKSAKLVEWDGDHRIPVKTGDLRRVLDAVLEVCGLCGIGNCVHVTDTDL